MTEKILFCDCEGDNYLEDLTRMWTIQIADDEDAPVVVYADQPGYPPIREALAKLKTADKVVFHYGMGFDLWAVNKLYPGTIRREQMIDTVIISRLMDSTSNRHNLAEMGEALGYPKGKFDEFDRFSEEMVRYGIRDVEILQRAWKGDKKRRFRSFGAFYKNFRKACELEFYTAYVIEAQRQHGFRFNFEDALVLEANLRQEMMDIERELQAVFPPIVTPRYSEKQKDKLTGKPKRLKDDVEVFNPNSRDQIARRLIDRYGWKPTKFTETKKVKVDEEVLSTLSYPEASLMARYMNLTKKIGMLADGDNAWLKLARMKGNQGHFLHGEVNTLGARTHRMSHYKPNLAQVDSDHRLRELFMANDDEVLVGVDAEGLELRMLAHYLAKYDGGTYSEIVHSGDKSKKTDIHSVNQRAAGLYSRDSAKTLIYAFMYGAGDAKLGRIAKEDAQNAGKPLPKQSDTAAGKALRDKLQTGIVGLGDLISKAQRSHWDNSALPGLDGRWIPNLSDHAALNTLLQGNGAIVMKQALVCFHEAVLAKGYEDRVHYCANVHDEFQLSVEPEIAEEVAEMGKQAITDAGLVLGIRCPLVGDAKIGRTWADTH